MTNDNSNEATLITSLAANLATPIAAPAVGNGANYGNTGKRFSIAFSTSTAAARLNKYSKVERVVSYSQMSQEVQTIHKAGGKILSITEVV